VKRNQIALILLFAMAYLFLRGLQLVNPGMTFDLDMYKEWLSKAAEFGVSQVYRTSHMDYPPLYAYILLPFGWLYAGLEKCGIGGSVTLTAVVKLPPLLFDLGIGWLLWRCTSLEGKPITSRAVAAAAYLFNPAVLFLTAYWGGPDSIHSFFILASFVTIAYGARFLFRPQADNLGRSTVVIATAWSLLALAALMKPLGLPYFPLQFDVLRSSRNRCGNGGGSSGRLAHLLTVSGAR
jgi:Gpi18-like mannosyltransferase